MKSNCTSEPLVGTVEMGTITVVSVRTSVLTDFRSITAVAEEVRAVSRRRESPNILLDFHCVEHLSVEFVSEMKTIVDEIEGRGGTIRCCSLRKDMRAVLRFLGLDATYAGHSVRHAVMRYATSLVS